MNPEELNPHEILEQAEELINRQQRGNTGDPNLEKTNRILNAPLAPEEPSLSSEQKAKLHTDAVEQGYLPAREEQIAAVRSVEEMYRQPSNQDRPFTDADREALKKEEFLSLSPRERPNVRIKKLEDTINEIEGNMIRAHLHPEHPHLNIENLLQVIEYKKQIDEIKYKILGKTDVQQDLISYNMVLESRDKYELSILCDTFAGEYLKYKSMETNKRNITAAKEYGDAANMYIAMSEECLNRQDNNPPQTA